MLKPLREKATAGDVFATVFEGVSGVNIVSIGCTARPYAAQFRPCFIAFIARLLYVINNLPVAYRSASIFGDNFP